MYAQKRRSARSPDMPPAKTGAHNFPLTDMWFFVDPNLFNPHADRMSIIS